MKEIRKAELDDVETTIRRLMNRCHNVKRIRVTRASALTEHHLLIIETKHDEEFKFLLPKR